MIIASPSRGLLRDYEPSDGTFWSTSWLVDVDIMLFTELSADLLMSPIRWLHSLALCLYLRYLHTAHHKNVLFYSLVLCTTKAEDIE